MTTAHVSTKDNVDIVSSMGTGEPVVFSHAWLLNADARDYALMFAASNGFRGIGTTVVADQAAMDGNDMDTSLTAAHARWRGARR